MSFFASALAASITIVAAIMPPLGIPGLGTTDSNVPPFPAPPGYLLPWGGGEIHAVTQGEETTLTHNGRAAYAFDFDLTTDTVMAARGGRVALVRMDSNVGGCSSAYSKSANYIVIDHGDGTSGLYLHLAKNGVWVAPGDLVWQGQIIGTSGATGLTCSDYGPGPGEHLHFQVQLTEAGHYFTQSLPIAFDDIPDNDGVPEPGRSYVSGNYGRGNEQKLKLTPHHDVRPFAPVARPADPTLLEGEHVKVPPMIGAPDTDTPTPEPAPDSFGPIPDTATPEPTNTPRATRTPTFTPSATPTPPPAPTATSVPTDTPIPPPTDTPVPPTETPVPPTLPPPPPPTDTPTPDIPPPATPTP